MKDNVIFLYIRKLNDKALNRKKLLIAAALVFGIGYTGTAQTGQVNIQQDSIIPKLLMIKTDMTKANKLGDRYRIQIFSGDNNGASNVLKDFRNQYTQWTSTIIYDTPNYKVWVGNFRNSLEADRALQQIKNAFPAAFRFRPERN